MWGGLRLTHNISSCSDGSLEMSVLGFSEGSLG